MQTPELTRGFGSDNHSPVHPRILEALTLVNQGHAAAYGQDPYTERARARFREIFNHPVEVFFVFNGTAANVLVLRSLLKSHEAVITAETSHLAVDECGAPEFHGGHKVLTCRTVDGKIGPEDIKPWLIRKGDQHAVQPRLVSIAQPTEFGTVYTIDELKRLRQFCNDNGLYLHMDGARLANACVQLNCSFADLTTGVGLDALSLGGAKNGLLGAEAVVLFSQSHASDFRFIQKQEMQLPSKVRFFAAQFEAYFANNFWREIAMRSCELAQKLAAGLREIPAVSITQKVESNAVFARVPKHWIKPLKDVCFFYVWNERDWTLRLMLSYDNDESDIRRFLDAAIKLSNQGTLT
jgi:threonine aldolase